ncbi:MAG: NAD(P)H-binding protein [Cytophagales bacterium]|nr:NAD(P)H-binding protein [Cytophagales bacterium]
MHIIMGGTGHIGSATADALLAQGQAVTIVSRSAAKAGPWQQKGAQVARVDVHDPAALHEVFRRGRRLFLLNPPAAPSTDTDAEERKSVASILRALAGSGLEKIVALSTYGAWPGRRIGDLGVLYEMEQGLAGQPIPATVIRAAYLMSNWEMSLPTVGGEGKLYTFFPPDFALPMVSPGDVGRIAAQLLLEPAATTGLYHVEGPARYSPSDVAAAFSSALRKLVAALQIPREQWIPTLKDAGFSAAGAESMAAMTDITLGHSFELPGSAIRGTTTLQAYVDALVRDSRPPRAQA